MGQALGKSGITLIYGGTTKGLMGIVANATLAAGGKAHGVITASLHERGQSHASLTQHEIVETLRLRKARMIEMADACIAMPGGIGTIEELMEVWVMNQFKEVDKPVGLLNTTGFYDKFLGFIDHMIESKFLPAGHKQSISVDADAEGLLDKLRSYSRVEVPKWL